MDIARMDLALARWSFRRNIPGRMRLWRKLATLLANGVPIMRALAELRDRRLSASGAKHYEAVGLGVWNERIGEGGSFAAAITGWVTPDERLLIAAGEERGDMTVAFKRLEMLLMARGKIGKAVIAGVSYPAVLLVLVFAVLIFFAWRVIPIYEQVAANKSGSFTGVAASLIWLAGTVRTWVWLWIVITIVAIVAFFISLPRWDGRVRVLADRYAPYGIYRVMRGTAWMLALSALVGVGKRVEDALLMLSNRESGQWSRTRTALCIAGIRRGLSLGAAMQAAGTEFPDREIVADLLVYSRLGGVEEAINLLAVEMLESSLERIQVQSAMLRNIGFVAVASVIGWTASGLVDMNLQMAKLLSGAANLHSQWQAPQHELRDRVAQAAALLPPPVPRGFPANPPGIAA